MTHGEFIKQKRIALNRTQEDVAKACETTKATVSRWESGDIQKMSPDMAQKLAKYLDIDIGILLFSDEVLFPGELALIYSFREANQIIRETICRLLDIKIEWFEEG